MIMILWEVYKRDSPEVLLFLDEQSALNQLIFPEVDFICQSEVEISEQEQADLFKNGYLRGQ